MVYFCNLRCLILVLLASPINLSGNGAAFLLCFLIFVVNIWYVSLLLGRGEEREPGSIYKRVEGSGLTKVAETGHGIEEK